MLVAKSRPMRLEDIKIGVPYLYRTDCTDPAFPYVVVALGPPPHPNWSADRFVYINWKKDTLSGWYSGGHAMFEWRRWKEHTNPEAELLDYMMWLTRYRANG